MELQPLRYFLSVLDTGSFSKAAAQHRVSQQAVSKSVARLEEQLGAELLRRVGRLLEPTEIGAVLAEHAQIMIAESHQFERKLNELTGRTVGHLQIGSSPTAAVSIVADVIHRMVKDEPRLRVTVSGGTTRSMSPQLKRGELDAFVGVLVQREPDPLLAVEELYPERTVLVARASHPLTHAASVSLPDSLGYPWLGGTGMEHWGDLVRSSFIDAGLSVPRPGLQTSSISFLRAMLVRTDSLAVLPVDLVRPEIEAGILAAVTIDGVVWQRPMALFYRRQMTRSKSVNRFIHDVRTLAATYGSSASGGLA